AGTVTVATGTAVAVSGGTLARPMTNHGTITIADSTGLTFSSSAQLTNAADGTIDLHGDNTSLGTNGGVSGSITNNGTITRSTGTGNAQIRLPLDNVGTIEVDTGTLAATSTFAAYNAATKTLTKGTYIVTGVFQFPSADIVHNSASITLVGGTADIQNTS